MLADDRSQRYDWEQRVVQCGVRAKEQFICARQGVSCARVTLEWYYGVGFGMRRGNSSCVVWRAERDSKLAMIRENIWGECVR